MQKPLSKGEQKLGRDKLEKIISTKMGLAEAPPNVTNKLEEICKKQSTINKVAPKRSIKRWLKRKIGFKPKNYFQKHDQQVLKNKIKTLVEEERTNNKQPLTSEKIKTIMNKALLGNNLVTINPKFDYVKIGETKIKKEDFKKSLDNIQDRFKEQVEQIKAALDSNDQVHNLQIPEAVINATGLITQETFFNQQEIAEYAANHKGELINENSGLTRPEIKQLKDEKQEKSKQNEAPKPKRDHGNRNILKTPSLVERVKNLFKKPISATSGNVNIADTKNLNTENTGEISRRSLGA